MNVEADAYTLYEGDAAEVLRGFPDASIDAVVTDPPAGISFMGKHWDADRGGRDVWVRWLTGIMVECLRVLKPGGHALVWALPRTSHWTATAIEDAGFEIRDVVTHHFGQGFPKSQNVGKSIDKKLGLLDQREVVGVKPGHENFVGREDHPLNDGWDRPWASDPDAVARYHAQTAPASEQAAAWEGWGTALKPASEHWLLARKPLEGTVAANVLAWGTGALNIDGCRVRYVNEADMRPETRTQGYVGKPYRHPAGTAFAKEENYVAPAHSAGRWPANLVLSHAPECVEVGVREVRTGVAGPRSGMWDGWLNLESQPSMQEQVSYTDNGHETVGAWNCVPGCPVAELDAQSGVARSSGLYNKGSRPQGSKEGPASIPIDGVLSTAYADTGGASRFFYVAKASTRERNYGLNGQRNAHPTVKPLGLMRWLVRLVTPGGGLVLDPFMGSGSTGVACLLEGMEFVGIETDPEMVAVAEARLERVATDVVCEVLRGVRV